METCRNRAEREYNMVFTTACEGGINYWVSHFVDYKWAAPDANGFEGMSEARDFYANIIVDDYDDDAPGVYRIDIKTIRTGIKRAFEYMRENVAHYDSYQRRAIRDLHSRSWDDVDYDATTADIIVQFGLFNELVYG
jgi:hypothetical protein